MKLFRFIAAISVVICFNASAGAQDTSSANFSSSNFWTRDSLSGDWGGWRTALAGKGVSIDMNLTQVGQGIVHGGKDTGWQYAGGRGNITLKLDSQKLGARLQLVF